MLKTRRELFFSEVPVVSEFSRKQKGLLFQKIGVNKPHDADVQPFHLMTFRVGQIRFDL
jgi:hypothetical protein